MSEQSRLDISGMTSEMELLKAELYFPDTSPPQNIQEILTRCADSKYLQTVGAAELRENAIVLASYSLELAKQENRFVAFAGWCERNIQFIIGKNLDQTPYTFYTEKATYIRANEPHAADLDAKRNVALTKVEYLKFLSSKIQFLSECLDNAAFAKEKELRHVHG